MKILSSKFFESKNTVKIAKSLLGKFLVRRHKGKTAAYLITEVEAYDGFQDKASHAHRGRTERNKIMFGPAGYWYVYFTYGVHWMLNIVTGPKDYPAAVLIRAVAEMPLSKTHPLSYRSSAQRADSLAFVGRSFRLWRKTLPASSSGRATRTGSASQLLDDPINLIFGPARLTKALKIDGKINGHPANGKSGLWIEDWGVRIGNPPSRKASEGLFSSLKAMKIKKGPRIRVAYAGPVWAKKKYRFFIQK